MSDGASTPFEVSAPESGAALTARLEALSAKLSELSPRIRDAIVWHHRDGYTCDEIGEKLSAATHRVKRYLVKGKAHCRSALPATTTP